MKEMIISIKPEWVAKILNKEKVIEVRKKFPINYKGWVYIYCSKDKNDLSSKVVARFWCDDIRKLEYVRMGAHPNRIVGYMVDPKGDKDYDVCKLSCLTYKELNKYLRGYNGYAININKLEIFDKPKELKDFGVKRAPQNYCYIKEDK